MIQDFTFFANITASYVNRKNGRKTNQSKTKQKQRSEWSTRSFRANIEFHPLGILNIYLMQTNYAFKTNTQRQEILIRRGKKAENQWKWQERRSVLHALRLFLQT